ncbi:MAG: hypothetical protein ACFFAN_04520 [Promethearchaeota archaeon]
MMRKKKNVIILLLIFFSFTGIGIFLRYFIIFGDPFCLKDWECDPDWKEPDYYKDGICDSKVEECARYGADNIAFSQSCNGKYRYIYDAENDEYDDENYNIVRHAGTTYAILDLCKELDEEQYLTVGEAGLDYLCSFNHVISQDKWAINYDSEMKVGTVSLAILGMVRYWEATGNEKYNEYVEKYANFIVSQQRNDGAFAGIYGSKKENLYYSGEAFYALALAYDMLEDKEYLEAIEKALDFYWSDDYEYDDSAFIPWASSGCAKWYELTDDKNFLNFCFEMTDINCARQHLINDTDKLGNDLYGYIIGPTVNTGVYLEGIGDALRVAKKINDNMRIQKYHDCLKTGIEWILSLQFRKKSELSCPKRGFGGFHRGFTVEDAYLIRIDYTQHAISAIIRVLREFDDDEIDNINIRDGIVDFEPVESNTVPLKWLIYPITLALGATLISAICIYLRKLILAKD